MTKELERFVNTDEVLRQQLDRRGRVVGLQEMNNAQIGTSASKVYDVRNKSPGSRAYPPGSFAGASTANPYDRSHSPLRGGSPLRSTYRPTYGKF